MRFLVFALLAGFVFPAAAQSKLVLPQSADDVLIRVENYPDYGGCAR